MDESKWRKWTSSEVERWLAKNPSLCALVPIFEENDVSGQDLQHLAAKDLKELGVSKELQAVLLEHLEELKLKYSKSSSTSGESGSEEQHQNTNQPDSRSKSLPQSKKDKEGKDDEKQKIVKKAKSVREGKGVENRNSFEREELELGDPISTSSFNRVCKGTWRGTVVGYHLLFFFWGYDVMIKFNILIISETLRWRLRSCRRDLILRWARRTYFGRLIFYRPCGIPT